ncbi:MAG: carbonic anhydrase [Monoraphidium minutum]|nr:MAG: carbonic anhydrase [Monoraphidium minutum]
MVWFMRLKRAMKGGDKRAVPHGSDCACCNEPLSDEVVEAYDHSSLDRLFDANHQWAASMVDDDPKFFERLQHQQSPEFLWIGCSDSRVPANQILGLAPGEIFVQRNVGNQALHTDLNVMSCLEYAVKSLKVKTVIVCGHYGCGAVRAALELPSRTAGLVNCWISDIREARNQGARELAALKPEERVKRLCELNVTRQVFHVCTSPVVQAAWAEGQELHVWGVIYDLTDGIIRRLAGPFSATSEVDETLDGFVKQDAKVLRDPLTNKLRLHAIAPGCGDSELDSTDSASPVRSVSELRRQVNNANLVNAVIRHTTWSTDGEHNTLACAARAGL